MDQVIVAIIYNRTDIHGNDARCDSAYTWETGRCLAESGFKIVAVADDGAMTIDKAQAIYDAAYDTYTDCFIEPLPVTRSRADSHVIAKRRDERNGLNAN